MRCLSILRNIVASPSCTATAFLLLHCAAGTCRMVSYGRWRLNTVGATPHPINPPAVCLPASVSTQGSNPRNLTLGQAVAPLGSNLKCHCILFYIRRGLLSTSVCGSADWVQPPPSTLGRLGSHTHLQGRPSRSPSPPGLQSCLDLDRNTSAGSRQPFSGWVRSRMPADTTACISSRGR